jgi:N-acetylmuramoyl-L-alanine amidase
MMHKIFIDAGHGGGAPGAVTGDVQEKNLNLTIALKLGTWLRANGFEVKFSRMDDRDVPFDQRVGISNEWPAEVFVSIHHNSSEHPGPSGSEVYSHPGSEHGRALAGFTAQELQRIPGLHCLGALSTDNPATSKIEYFYVLRKTDCPAILVECYFMNNLHDLAWGKTAENQFLLVNAIGRGVENFFKSLDGREQT